MSGADALYDNYDSVFKDSMLLYKGKLMEFCGFNGDLRITEPLKTETKEIVVTTDYSDMSFLMNNGKGLHMEEEVSISQDDIIRFCGYNIHLTRTYKIEFLTVILTNKAPVATSINHECLKYNPIIVNLGERDADSTIQRLRQQIKDGKPINELEIVYLTLYHSDNLRPVEILRQCAELISQVDASDENKRKLAALTLVASNKVVSKEDLEQIWEEVIKMTKLKILEVVEEQSEIRGEKRGIGKSAEIIRALKKNETVENIAERYQLTIEDIKQIQSALL